MTRPNTRLRQRGVSLIEAMVAMAIMAFGMLAVVGVQSTLRFNADIAKQRAEATRLAERELEAVRSFSTVGSGGATEAEYDSIATHPEVTHTAAELNSSFRLGRTVTAAPGGQSKTITVTVAWKDRTDVDRTISMHDVIARADPLLSGLVKAPKPFSVIGRRDKRHPTIPVRAHDLGDGTSIFKPTEAGTIAWVFNNSTGVITHKCTGLAGASSTLTSGDVSSSCTLLTISAQLLAGEIRFNLRGATKDLGTESVIKPVAGGDVAWVIDHSLKKIVRICPVSAADSTTSLTAIQVSTGCTSASVAIDPFAPSDATYSLAATDSEAPKWPSLPVTVVLVAPLSGISSHTCISNAATSSYALATVSPAQMAVEYFCIIEPTSTSGWAGRAELSPVQYSDGNTAAWSTGTTAGTYKVCRFTQSTTDYTENVDHPRTYSVWSASCAASLTCRPVIGNLVNQNYLVIAGTKSCPTDVTATPASGDMVNSNTLQHQP